MSNGLRSARRALHGGSGAFASKFQKHQRGGPKLDPMSGPLAVQSSLTAASVALRSAKKAMRLRLKSLRMRVQSTGGQ